MSAADTTPRLRIDRYLALLAILLALVLGLLVIGERQRAAPLMPVIEGTLPPAASTTTTTLPAAVAAVDREALFAEQTRLATRLRETEAALRRAEAEIEQLREQNRLSNDRLQGEGAALDELARRLAVAEADRDRLAAEVDSLAAIRDRLEARLVELGRGEALRATAEPRTTAEDVRLARDPSASDAAQPRGLQAAVEELIRDQQSYDVAPADAAPAATGPADPAVTGRMITFNGSGGTVADGVQAYRDGDFVTAERIWGALAVSGEPRAQFHFGALMYEGRTAAPDRVMAYVWLSRAVEGGHLPAIELRRQVRAAMSEAEYQEALAIQSSS